MVDLNTSSIITTLTTADYTSIAMELFTKTYPELLIFTLGLFVYAVSIYVFYKHLSKRDLFRLNLREYDGEKGAIANVKKAGSVLLYIVRYGIVFPLYVGLWFAMLTILLFVMAKNVGVRELAIIALSLVSAVRITAYLSEELAQDLAKLIPFALLALFLSDPTFFTWDLLIERFGGLSALIWEILKFLSFSIILEWGLRIIYGATTYLKGEPGADVSASYRKEKAKQSK